MLVRFFAAVLALLLGVVPAEAIFLRAGGNNAVAPPSTNLQIFNAPGWLQSHAYVLGSRVNAGAGWNPTTSKWTAGSLIVGFQQTNGPCTSSATGNGPTPGSLSDGTCQWTVIVNPVDYVTLTGALNDDNQWASGQAYFFHDYVEANDGGTWRMYGACWKDKNPTTNCPGLFLSTPFSCTSGSTAPTGTSTTAYVWDGGTPGSGCPWSYITDLTYSSQSGNFVPHEKWLVGAKTPSNNNRATIEILKDYTFNIWNGQEYLAGANGEASSIQVLEHLDIQTGSGTEWGLTCAHGVSPFCGGPANNKLSYYRVETAAGESFRDQASFVTSPFTFCGTATVVGTYDSKCGVTVESTRNNNNNGDAAIYDLDYGAGFWNMQFRSAHQIALNLSDFGAALELLNSIVDSNGGSGIFADCGATLANDLIVNRSTHTGAAGITYKYAELAIFNDTIILTNPSATGSTYIQGFSSTVNGGSNGVPSAGWGGTCDPGDWGHAQIINNVLAFSGNGTPAVNGHSLHTGEFEHAIPISNSLATAWDNTAAIAAGGTGYTVACVATMTNGVKVNVLGVSGGVVQSLNLGSFNYTQNVVPPFPANPVGQTSATPCSGTGLQVNFCYALCASRMSNNATDAASTSSNTTYTPFQTGGLGGTQTGTVMLGVNNSGCGSSCYGLSASAVFVNPASDWRICTVALCGSNAPVQGAGAAFTQNQLYTGAVSYSNATDIGKQSRPGSHGYTPGAWQDP